MAIMGRIKGRILGMLDESLLPEDYELRGFTARVVAVPQRVSHPEDDTLHLPIPVDLVFDRDGVLRMPQHVTGEGVPTGDAEDEISLVATDDAAGSPVGWTYQMRLSGPSIASQTFHFALPGGTVVDLADLAPVASDGGVQITRGAGVAAGGLPGQVLAKATVEDYSTEWVAYSDLSGAPDGVVGVHVTTGSEARPSASMVLWVGGDTQPENMASGDVWLASGTPVAPTAPTVTTSSLGTPTVGVPYSRGLAASGDAPITWSITAGALPDGLSLSSSTVSGTPTTAGAYSVTLTATNSAGSDSRAYTGSVAAG